jgi:hypothetical protein
MSTFICKHKWKRGETEEWIGQISKVIDFGSHYEIFIQSRSSILVILAKTSYGIFAGIPTFKAGCYISDLNDLFSNKENLIHALKNTVDGITVAYALKTLADNLAFN